MSEDIWKDHEKFRDLHDQRVRIGQIDEFTKREEVESWSRYWGNTDKIYGKRVKCNCCEACRNV